MKTAVITMTRAPHLPLTGILFSRSSSSETNRTQTYHHTFPAETEKYSRNSETNAIFPGLFRGRQIKTDEGEERNGRTASL